MRLARMDCLPARPQRRARSRTGSRAKFTIAASLLGLAGALSAAVPAKALSTEQGSINVVGSGTWPGPCTGCQVAINGVSSGYVAGADTNLQPFTVAWATPIPATMQLTLGMNTTCANITDVVPSVSYVSGVITITNATLVYQGLQMPASVTASFNTVPLANQVIVISGLTVSVTAGSIFSTTLLVNGPNGYLNLAPVGTNLCAATTMAASANIVTYL
jgi:hypothetical protein